MIELGDPVRPASAHQPEQPASRWIRFVRFVVPPMGVAALVIGMWLFITYSLLREDQRPFLPPPQEVVSRGFLDWDRLQPILAGLGRTALVAVTGLAIAFVIGTAVAVVMSLAMSLERTVYPYAVILQTVPLVAIAPLVGLRLGFSNTSRIVICVLISLFPIIANTLFGLKSATLAAARPLPAASRFPLDTAVEAAVPRRPAVDLRRAAHRRGPVRDRRHRRRVLLPGG